MASYSFLKVRRRECMFAKMCVPERHAQLPLSAIYFAPRTPNIFSHNFGFAATKLVLNSFFVLPFRAVLFSVWITSF